MARAPQLLVLAGPDFFMAVSIFIVPVELLHTVRTSIPFSSPESCVRTYPPLRLLCQSLWRGRGFSNLVDFLCSIFEN